MKKMAKFFSAVFTLTILLQSCANYKPIAFNSETKRFNNYKDNYSIEILDGYNLITSETKEKLRKAFFPDAPKSIVVFYDKDKEIMLFMFVTGNFTLSQSQKKEVLDIMEKELKKTVKKCKECNKIKIIKSGQDVTAEMDTNSEFGDGKAVMKFIPFPLSKDSAQHGLFAIASTCKENVFETAKIDYFKMVDSLQLTAFNNEERTLD